MSVAPAPPVSPIHSFVASSPLVLAGETVTVTGIFEGSGRIDGVGPVTSGVPVTIGPINGETTVTLVVQSPSGLDWTQSATIRLLAPPTITTFTADPASIGIGAFSTLFWRVDGQVDTTRIDPPGMQVSYLSALTAGPLTSTTSYLLTATNRAGTTSATVEVVVLPASSIEAFTASASTTGVGGAVVLTASFQGTGEILKENMLGQMERLGTLASGGSLSSGALYRNTRFTLRVIGGSTVTQDLVVTVTGPGTFEPVSQPDFVAQDAVVLRDGTVFITSQRRAYVFDPATRQFTPSFLVSGFPTRYLALLRDGRVFAVSPPADIGATFAEIIYGAGGNAGLVSGLATQAIALPDGRALVRIDPRIGVDSPGIVLFDPATGSLGPLIARPSLAGTRGVLLADGRVLFIRMGAPSEIFTPGPDTFSLSSAAFGPRGSLYASALLPDGRVLVNGGAVGPSQPAELYDPARDTVARGGAQGTPNLVGQGAAVLSSGQVLLVGGSSYATSLLFDPATRTFAQTGGLHTPRSSPVTVRLQDGRVLVLGGCSFTPCGAEIYTPP